MGLEEAPAPADASFRVVLNLQSCGIIFISGIVDILIGGIN